MPQFTQWQVPDPTPNILYNPAAVDKAVNETIAGRQANSATDMEMVGRAASSLLGMSEPDAAAAYPGMVADLQRQGFARSAPSIYPGHAAVQMFVQRALPLTQQITAGYLTSPAVLEARRLAGQPSPYGDTGTGGGGADATGGGGGLPPADPNSPAGQVAQRTAAFWKGQGYSDAVVAGIMAGGPGAESDFNPGAVGKAGEIGLYQHNADRKAALLARYGANPTEAQQHEFAAWEISPNGPLASVGAQLRAAKTPEEAAAIWTKGFESPANADFRAAERAAKAGKYVGYGAAPTTAPPATASRFPTLTPVPGAPTVRPPPTAASAVPPPLAPVQVAGPGAPTDTPAPAAPSEQVEPETGLPLANTLFRPDTPGLQTRAAPLAPPAPATAPPATARPVATGVNSPQFRAAMDMQRRALILESVPDPSGVNQRQAAAYRAQAALYMQADSVVQTREGQLHTLTGKIDDPAKPLPNYVYDANQHAYIDTTGTNKPEFQPAQRDSAVAQRDVMELGPKVANGSATPEEQARYATAVETYRDPVLRENPVTKETVRVNRRELPAGFPEPTGLRGGGAAGGAAVPGGSQVVIPGYSPEQQEIERNPAKAKVADEQYGRDSKEVAAIGDAGRQAQADQVRIKEMQDVLQRFSTGFGTEARTAAAAFFQKWLPATVTGWEKESANLSGGDAAQAFSKMALVGAGTQERGVLGGRGGYQAIKLFKDANPSVNLQDATNKSILDMQLISNQANQDYSQAALSHYTDNETKYARTHQYDSLAQFDRNWNAQRNPQVYAAAMGAISGQQPSQWAKGLSEGEYKRALDIVSRANPDAVVNAKSGRISMQPAGSQASAPVAVKTPADAAALPPGTSYTTPDGKQFVR